MKKTEMKIKILAIYQILGGLIGLVGILHLILKIKTIDKIILMIIGFCGFSIYCGYTLLKKDYFKGLNLSIINQLIQVLSFTIFGLTYKVYSGIFLYLGLDLTNDPTIIYGTGLTMADFQLDPSSPITEFSINFVALILINIIFNLREKIEIQMKNTTANSGLAQ